MTPPSMDINVLFDTMKQGCTNPERHFDDGD